MPVILFTASEVIPALATQMDELAAKIRQLSDLDACPLNPGESPDVRRHELAKLGKRLAEAWTSFAEVMRQVAEANVEHGHEVATPTTTNQN